MELFNLIEMIVKEIVDEVLTENKKFKDIKFHKNDIIAYVLNRVQPRYVTGERGIIHSSINHKTRYQQQSDILFLVYEALEIFSKRRPSEIDSTETGIREVKGFLPHMLGEALEESTLGIIPDLKTTLYFDNSPAEMIDPGWKNPYILTLATRGYYHFWPAYNEAKMSGADAATFEVRFEHQKLQSQTISITVKINRKKDFIMVKPIPLVLMKLKEGISPDFLDA